jgi:hypothetical protein
MIPLLLIPRKAKPVHVDAGTGVAVRKVAGRHLVSLRRQRGERFEGSWWVTVNTDGPSPKITVDRGYVNSMEPTIGGVPIGGIMPNGEAVTGGQPSLSFSGSGGMAWVCLRVTPGTNGKINPKSNEPKLTEDVTVEVVGAGQVSGKAEGKSWYYPLAALSPYGKVAQMAYFDLACKIYKKSGDRDWRFRFSLEALTWRNLEELIAEDEAIRKAIAS